MRSVMMLTCGVTLFAGASPGHAEPWWVTWSGDTYPQTEGWARWASDPPPQRWLQDGKLFIDWRGGWGMHEESGQVRPG